MEEIHMTQEELYREILSYNKVKGDWILFNSKIPVLHLQQDELQSMMEYLMNESPSRDWGYLSFYCISESKHCSLEEFLER